MLKRYCRYHCSPENHNVIRCGKNVSPRPNLDKNIYNDYLKNPEEKIYELPKVFIPYLDDIFSSISHMCTHQ
jgi:hypothetical protein